MTFRTQDQVQLRLGSAIRAFVWIVALLAIPSSYVIGQARPEAPAALCIVGFGACDDEPTGGTGMKWHPGHYLKTQGNHADSNVGQYLDSVRGQLSKVLDSHEIQGAMVIYSWGMVEPKLGQYDWSPIYAHLDWLSRHNKRLIIDIEYKCFAADCGSLAPDELNNEVFVTPREYPTQIVELWEKENMDRFLAMWRALAAEFDDHPNVEFITSAESSPSLQGESPANYSRGGYAAQLKRLYAEWSISFKHTTAMAMVNFLSGEVSDLIEEAYQLSIGRGDPDMHDSTGTVIFRGGSAGGENARRDYRRMLPHFFVVSAPTLNGRHGAEIDRPREVIRFGVANDVTHFAWVASLTGEDSWANIITEIERVATTGYTACPIRYIENRGGCNQ